MNVLVINLTRFGDLLQSQPVFHALKAQGHRVGLLCLNSFEPVAELLSDVDYVFALPAGKVLAKLDKNWHESLGLMYELSNKIQKDFLIDIVINLSATVSARLVANFFGNAKCEFRCFCLDAYGFGYCANSWAAYLLGSTQNRINCSFNIVDMFYMSGKCVSGKITNSLRQPSIEILEEIKNKIQLEFKDYSHVYNYESKCLSNKIDDKLPYNILNVGNSTKPEKLAPKLPAKLCTSKVFKTDGNNGFVTFQLGASNIHRQWPIEYFAALGNSLWSEFKICPILLGTEAEKSLGQEYAKHAKHKFIDCIGATNVPQLASLVSLSRLLVTNDTGTMHLAAGLGIPILAFFLATAQAWDTAPYLENSCCLEPALACHPCSFKNKCENEYACTKVIDPETVTTLISQYLKRNKWEYPLNTDNYNSQVRIWTTFKDNFGFMDLKCLSQHELEDRTLWIRIQRHFIKYMLDCLNGGVGINAELSWPDKYLVEGISAKLHEDIYKVLCTVENLLFLLMQNVQLVKNKPELKLGGKIISTYNKIQMVFSQMPHFVSLEYFWIVTLNEHSQSLDSVFEKTALIKNVFSSWREYWEK